LPLLDKINFLHVHVKLRSLLVRHVISRVGNVKTASPRVLQYWDVLAFVPDLGHLVAALLFRRCKDVSLGLATELLLPGECKLRSGMYHYTLKKIMGTRTPFATDTVQVVESLEDGHLHLKSPSESRALKLLPLVKVMPSPKTAENACYFYNRRQADGIRFLSYYFESDAEVVEEFGDVAKALGDLMPVTNR
jgi:hypothetical protein